MKYERTLSIIKPDVMNQPDALHQIGRIYQRIAAEELKMVAAKMEHLTQEKAEQLYAVHRHRPFFKDFVKFMISGPIMVQVLEGEQAIARYRNLMGNTDPQKAAPDTLRAVFGKSVSENAVHGSDSPESARDEINLFFKETEIYGSSH